MAPGPNTKELRGDITVELAQALDAIALSRGMSRHQYVIAVLEKEVKRIAHANIILNRIARGNPYFEDTGRNQPEAADDD